MQSSDSQPEVPTGPDSEPDTSELVRHTQAGDLAPFGRLYCRIAPALFAWADLRIPRHVRSHLEPEELVQEVWCRALDKIASFDPERPFRYWVFKIASNTLLESLRRASRRAVRGTSRDRVSSQDPAAIPAEITTVSRRVARDEGLQSFLREVAMFPVEDRKLLLYRGLEGLSHDEVAERLSITVQASHKRWQRLRERLREYDLPQELLLDD